jgi:hypothetical protein
MTLVLHLHEHQDWVILIVARTVGAAPEASTPLALGLGPGLLAVLGRLPLLLLRSSPGPALDIKRRGICSSRPGMDAASSELVKADEASSVVTFLTTPAADFRLPYLGIARRE